MARTAVQSLGPLRVDAELEADVAAPRLAAVDAEGRRFVARAIGATLPVTEALVARFTEDAKAAAALAHPSLAPPAHHGVEPCFVASPDLGGITLSALLEEGPTQLDAAVTASIALDVAEGLAEAHRVGVVHGGVGPSAIVVAPDGRGILGDFAIASLAAALANQHSQVLQSAAAQLTPEQLTDSPTLTAATDVFSLGSTLYRLLGGAFPFEAPSPLAMTLKLQMGKYDPLEKVAPGTPEALSNLVAAMLSTDPSKRPSTEDVVRELKLAAPPDAHRREGVRATLPASAAPAPAPVPAPQTGLPTQAPSVSQPPSAAAAPAAANPPAAPPAPNPTQPGPPAAPPAPSPAHPRPPPAAPPPTFPSAAGEPHGAPIPVAMPAPGPRAPAASFVDTTTPIAGLPGSGFGGPTAAPPPAFGGPTAGAAEPEPPTPSEREAKPTIAEGMRIFSPEELGIAPDAPESANWTDPALAFDDERTEYAPGGPPGVVPAPPVQERFTGFDTGAMPATDVLPPGALPGGAGFPASPSAPMAGPAPAPAPAATPAPATSGIPPALIWAGVALGAFGFLGGLVLLVIYLAS